MTHIKTKAWTDQQRQQMLEEYYDSGLAKKEFCVAKNLQQSTLQLWMKKFATEHHEKSTTFIPVTIAKEASQCQPRVAQSCMLEIGICKLHLHESQLAGVLEILVKLC